MSISQEYLQALMAGSAAPKSNKGKFVYKGGQYIDPEEEKPKSKKGSGDQSWLSSIISELGGAGGATAGAAAGATIGSVVPGIGTLLGGIGGGIAGGFAGGFGGRLAENQIRDNEMRVGDALGEGLVSGAFGGLGAGFQGARGAYAAGKAGGLGGQGFINTVKGGSGLLDDAVRGASTGGGLLDDAIRGSGKVGRTIIKSGAKSGKAIGQGVSNIDDIAYASQKGLQSGGGKLRGVNRGIVSGNSGLSPDDVARQNRALDGVNKWFSGIGKSSQYNNADDAMKALSNTYKTSGEGAIKFGTKNSDDLLKAFKKNIAENQTLKGNLTKQNQQIVKNLTDDIAKFKGKTNADFVDFMAKKINPRYRTISASGGAGSKESQILEAFRSAGKDLIDKNMATRSGINKQFSNLIGATDSLGKTITRDQGAGAGQGLTLGRMLGNVAGGGMDVVGRGMQQAGKVSQFTTPVIGGALARGMVNGGQPQDQMQDPNMQDTSGMFTEQMPQDTMGGQQFGGQGMGQQGLGEAIQGFDQPQTPEQYNPYAPQNLQSSIAQIMQQGGDMGDVKDFLAIATSLDKLGGTDEQELTAIQRNKIAGYNTANTVVDSLEQLWQGVSQPGNQGLAGLSGIPGVKQARSTFDPNVRQYTQFAEGTLAPIIKSLGETGVLTDRDIIRAYGLVPNLQDSPDVAKNKITQLRSLLTNAEVATADQAGGEEQFVTQSQLASQMYQ